MAQLYPQAPGILFSRLLRHALTAVGLPVLFPGHSRENSECRRLDLQLWTARKAHTSFAQILQRAAHSSTAFCVTRGKDYVGRRLDFLDGGAREGGGGRGAGEAKGEEAGDAKK